MPLVVLIEAQEGRPVALKVSASPSVSVAAGWKT
jgi:hypothetical protein